MAGTRISMKLICSAVVLAVCIVAVSTSVEAKTNFAKKKAKPAIEESTAPAAEAKAACCPDPSACQGPKKKSLGKRIGSRITRFLAFGDRVNYGFTNWLLSDKREAADDAQR